MYRYFAVAAFGLIFVTTGFAQTPQPPNKKFDAELAKKVGADDYGMRQYVLAILKTGPKAVFKGHFDNMERLAKEGKLAVAGPFADPEKKFRGLFIFAVKTVEEAKALAETDPTVKAGVLVVEYVPWYGSASLMLSNELHEKVQAKSF
jgi:uncharacterized protein YciI